MKQKWIGIKNGLFLGLLQIFMLTIVYIIDIRILVNYSLITTIVTFLLIIFFGVLSIISEKKGLDGFISFKRAFYVFFVVTVIGIMMNFLFSYSLLNIIDPDSGLSINRQIYEIYFEQLKNYNLPQHIIRNQLNIIENKNFIGFFELLKSVGISLVVAAILGIISSFLFMKKIDD